MLKKSTSWAVMLYGLLLIILGSWGYYSSASKISLYAGGGLGLLLFLSSLLMFSKKRIGAYSALFLTFLLTALFAIRYSMTGKVLPATLAVVSGGMLLFLLAQSVHWKKMSK